MKKIDTAFSHIEYQKWTQTPYTPLSDNNSVNKDILASKPILIKSFRDLVKAVAAISNFNREYHIFFRGVKYDYKNENKTTILPSIYWDKGVFPEFNLNFNFQTLNEKSVQLVNKLRDYKSEFPGALNVFRFEELQWAILQHYRICPTPLLDITQSLQVACSFATLNNSNETGIIYLLGMPYINGPISFHFNDELINLRLLNICPPQAMRPFFQEGYLAGHFPNYRTNEASRSHLYDFSQRLIAKFEIPVGFNFWGQNFKALPLPALYPESDPMKQLLIEMMRPE